MVDEHRDAGLREATYAILRVMAALLLLQHALRTLFGMLQMPNATEPWEAPALLSRDWFEGTIQLVGGVLLALGLFTRPAAFVLSGLMAAAYFIVHSKWFAGSFFPIINRGELAALYCFVFLYFSTAGGGRYSLDALLRGRRRSGAAVPAQNGGVGRTAASR
jgi:putative oxidoreductase